jgi:hypothetical protein
MNRKEPKAGSFSSGVNNLKILAELIETDASVGGIFDIKLTSNAFLKRPENGIDGSEITWRIKQDSVGLWSLTLDNDFRIPQISNLEAILNSELFKMPNKMTILKAVYNDPDQKWDVILQIEGY